jgi:biotin operon repressor
LVCIFTFTVEEEVVRIKETGIEIERERQKGIETYTLMDEWESDKMKYTVTSPL